MIVGPSSQTPLTLCPYCKHKLDAAFGVGNEDKPNPGDVSLCGGCAGWLVFGPDLELVKPSQKILAEILADPQCQFAQAAALQVIRRRTEKN